MTTEKQDERLAESGYHVVSAIWHLTLPLEVRTYRCRRCQVCRIRIRTVGYPPRCPNADCPSNR